jgi:hypothetical protein
MLIQNFLIGIVFWGSLYYLPIYFQTACQLSLLTSAALVLPLVIPQAIASASSGQYISRTGRYGEVLWAGYICWTAAVIAHLAFSRTLSLGAVAVVLGIEGLGVGLIFQPS